MLLQIQIGMREAKIAFSPKVVIKQGLAGARFQRGKDCTTPEHLRPFGIVKTRHLLTTPDDNPIVRNVAVLRFTVDQSEYQIANGLAYIHFSRAERELDRQLIARCAL